MLPGKFWWNAIHTLCCANKGWMDLMDVDGWSYVYVTIWIWNGHDSATAPTQSEAELCRFQGSRAESVAWHPCVYVYGRKGL